MRDARRWLIVIGMAAILAVVFAGWMFGSGSGTAIDLVELLCGLLLLQLPAVGWRMAGGSRVQVMAVAVVVPLAVAEVWLNISAVENSGHGGDLQGVEYTMMWLVIAPIVVGAAIFTWLSGRLIPIDPPADD